MDIISAILDIDNKAKEMMHDAEIKSDEIIKKSLDEQQEVQSGIMLAAQQHIDEFRENEQASAQLEFDKIDEHKKSSIEKLDSEYDSNHADWEDTIFKSIVEI